MAAEKRLSLPADENDLRSLHVGDVVRLSGKVFTFRDRAHTRALAMLDAGEKLPFDLSGSAIWHCGPIVRHREEGWEIVSAGSTTSMRMDKIEPVAIERLGLRVIVGKGGMGPGTAEVLKKVGGVYLATVGGCAALLAAGVTEVVGVHWLDLGVPEAVWELQVSDFGPLIVSIDSTGENLHADWSKATAERAKSLGVMG